MRREVLMPVLSDEVEEGMLVTWLVEPGAVVREGDLIAEVQVQKVSADVPAPADGQVVELLLKPGGVVKQGEPIAVIQEVAATESPAPAAPAAPAAAGASGAPAAAPLAPRDPGGVGVATPAARRLARELGVDVATVPGSGPGRRIVEADVRAAAEGARRALPLSPMRQTIAARLKAGLASTAQLTLTAEADVTVLAGELERLTAQWGRRASYTEAVVRASALALKDHPELGIRLSEAGLEYPERIDIGVAVALEEGLIVPVVREADGKDLETLTREIADLAQRSRDGRLSPAETEGGVFSVTNLGAYGIDAFTPLLNPPQSAILGIGQARPRPAVVGGRIEVRTLLVLSLTFDHQVVDGAPAAAFLADVVRDLKGSDRLLLTGPRPRRMNGVTPPSRTHRER